jgi:hypothetical protein
MPTKTVSGEYMGHKVVAENTWFHGAKLIVNGDIVATYGDLFVLSKTKPIMTAHVDFPQQSKAKIEVFAFALFTVKMQIMVNGEKIAGDEL